MLFQCGGLLNGQTEMEPLVIDFAKEEAKMAKKNSTYFCLLLIIQFLNRLCNIFSQINSAEKVLPNNEF